MRIDEAIETEAQAQAICMQTRDYARAYEAFVARLSGQLTSKLRSQRKSCLSRGSTVPCHWLGP
jgi:hypothetical protein